MISGIDCPEIAAAIAAGPLAADLCAGGWLTLCFELLDSYSHEPLLRGAAWTLLLLLSESSNAAQGAAGAPTFCVSAASSAGSQGHGSATGVCSAAGSQAMAHASKALSASVGDIDGLLALLAGDASAVAATAGACGGGSGGIDHVAYGQMHETAGGYPGGYGGGGDGGEAWRLPQRAALGLLQCCCRFGQLPAPAADVYWAMEELLTAEEGRPWQLRCVQRCIDSVLCQQQIVYMRSDGSLPLNRHLRRIQYWL